MAGKRTLLSSRLSLTMASRRTDTVASASTLAELLVHDSAALNAELRAQMDKQSGTIHEIHQAEVENQKLSKIMEEYKRRNAELLKENAKLLSENERLKKELSSKMSKKLLEQNEHIQQREKRVGDQEEQLAFIETQYRNLAEYLLNGEAKFKTQVQRTKEAYEEKVKELDRATKEYRSLMRLQDKEEVIPTTLDHFMRQKEELLDLADERVRQLKVKEEEAEALKKRLRELQQTVATLKDQKVNMAKIFPAKPPPPASVPGFRRRSTTDALTLSRQITFLRPLI